MIDHINALLTSWYLSPPWGRTIPSVEVNLLERVYLRTTRTFGYCCGMQWKHECWIYSVDCGNEILHATQNQIIGTGELEAIKVQKPAFVLGERVMLCSHDKGTKQRLILGLHYYGYEAGKRCTTQASLACEAFESIGVRAWIQDLLGWTKPANPSETAMTQIQLLAAIAQQMAQQEQYLLEQQQQQTQILARLKAVEVEQDRVNTPCGHKYSVVGFANLQGLEISVKEAGTKGRKASALCRKQGIEIERIHDPRFGKVGLYPESILVEVFKAEQN